ncbi:hypothetical protein FB451DRAFT_1524424 [Mycena latifolia]|nr:hypothetical protein FB451DRAFT_1524424 [Mycena latifolia]
MAHHMLPVRAQHRVREIRKSTPCCLQKKVGPEDPSPNPESKGGAGCLRVWPGQEIGTSELPTASAGRHDSRHDLASGVPAKTISSKHHPAPNRNGDLAVLLSPAALTARDPPVLPQRAISDKSSTLAECCGRRLGRWLEDVLLECARALQTASARAHSGGDAVVVRSADDQPRVGRAGGPPGMTMMRREPLTRWMKTNVVRGERDMPKDKQRTAAVCGSGADARGHTRRIEEILYGCAHQPHSTGRELVTAKSSWTRAKRSKRAVPPRRRWLGLSVLGGEVGMGTMRSRRLLLGAKQARTPSAAPSRRGDRDRRKQRRECAVAGSVAARPAGGARSGRSRSTCQLDSYAGLYWDEEDMGRGSAGLPHRHHVAEHDTQLWTPPRMDTGQRDDACWERCSESSSD